jgi:hypothetical protein
VTGSLASSLQGEPRAEQSEFIRPLSVSSRPQVAHGSAGPNQRQA